MGKMKTIRAIIIWNFSVKNVFHFQIWKLGAIAANPIESGTDVRNNMKAQNIVFSEGSPSPEKSLFAIFFLSLQNEYLPKGIAKIQKNFSDHRVITDCQKKTFQSKITLQFLLAASLQLLGFRNYFRMAFPWVFSAEH